MKLLCFTLQANKLVIKAASTAKMIAKILKKVSWSYQKIYHKVAIKFPSAQITNKFKDKI